MSFYRRRLPHWQPEGVPIFVTWRLHGSLPRATHIFVADSVPEGRRFFLWDCQLDSASSGPTFLKNPQVAAAVVETLLTVGKKWGLYELFA